MDAAPTREIISMPQASAALEAWTPPQYTLTTHARAGETWTLREFPWLATKRLLAAVQTKLAPAFREGFVVYSASAPADASAVELAAFEAQREQAIFTLLEKHAPSLFEIPELAEDLICAVMDGDRELLRLDSLNSRDMASLAILSLRLLLVELADAGRFFTSELAAGLLGSSSAAASGPAN